MQFAVKLLQKWQQLSCKQYMSSMFVNQLNYGEMVLPMPCKPALVSLIIRIFRPIEDTLSRNDGIIVVLHC